MKNERRLNAIVGGAVTLVVFLTYLRTLAPTTSFWDCGEFIASSYILGAPHPPGAPLYLLIGRVFTMIPFAADIGFRVNLISAIVSALTVLFAYLIIVRLVRHWRGDPQTLGDRFTLYASGVVGSLALAFSDSVWFNAVEAEVYALSLFFTAAVVWLILVWMEKADDPRSDRYLLMIFYCVGLAIGVHLLNILALPFVFLVFYFRKFKPASVREFFLHGSVAVLLLGLSALVGMLFKTLFLGMVLFLVGHYIYYRNKTTEAARRYTHVAFLVGGGVAIFVVIHSGVIKGIPYVADTWSLGALGVLVVVLILAIVVAATARRRWVSLLLLSLFLIILGYSTYTAIFIRSGMNPVIDEYDPETTENMVKYINREQYGTWGTLPRRFPGIPEEIEFKQQYPNRSYAFYEFGRQMKFFWNYQLNKMYWRYFGWQFIGKGKMLDSRDRIIELVTFRGLYALPFLVGLFGMMEHFLRDWKRALSILVLFVMTGIAIVVYLNQPDPQPRERDYVYVGSFFAFALWIGVGAAAVFEQVGHALRDRGKMRGLALAATAIVLLLVVPINLFSFNFESHDRAGNYVAYDYSYNILESCEQDAIVFTNGDNDTFPLWFLQEVYGIRKDVRVVCLSLLNTHWYIKQLRDLEPRVPINLSDRAIDRLYPIPWKKQEMVIPVPDDVYEKKLEALKTRLGDSESGPLKKDVIFTLEPTFQVMGETGLQVKDLMVLRILQAAEWRRPVYFALTVSNDNKLGLERYFRLDGLAFKVVPYPREPIDPQKLMENLLEKYQYRSLSDPSVYLNVDVVKLLQNLRSVFLELARYYINKGQMEDAVFILDEMGKRVPETCVPYSDERSALLVAHLYERTGHAGEYEKRLEYVLPGRQLSRDERIWLGSYYSQVFQDWDRAEAVLLPLVRENPDDARVYSGLFLTYQWFGQYDKASALLEGWLMRHPMDENAKKELEALKALAAADTAATGAQDSLPE